jgi:hypothetical protein
LQGNPKVGIAKIAAELAWDEAEEFAVRPKPNIPMKYPASCTFREPERRDDTDRNDRQKTLEKTSDAQRYAPRILAPLANRGL